LVAQGEGGATHRGAAMNATCHSLAILFACPVAAALVDSFLPQQRRPLHSGRPSSCEDSLSLGRQVVDLACGMTRITN
ncbi:MAG: hypothetical protein Q4F23_01450, partial [Coriobacteriia bacterium]|nr:hypothetical protein [Coriobacteriia bacterium]